MPDNNISAYGLKINLVASVTFPAGFDFDGFASDGDALTLDEHVVADSKMTFNGYMPYWKVSNPRNLAVNVIPNTEGEDNLRILLNANRANHKKRAVDDLITLIVDYPDGSKGVYSNGIIISGSLQPTVAGTGQLKSSTFKFRFRDFVIQSPS